MFVERGRLARFLTRCLHIFACLVSANRLHRVSVSYHMLARGITGFLDTFACLVSMYLLATNRLHPVSVFHRL